MRWGMFFLAEFIEIVFISAIMATVFFGGWQVPFLDADGFRLGQPRHWRCRTSSVLIAADRGLGLKVILFCWFQLMIRWTLPRFRADQLMNLGWKLLLPIVARQHPGHRGRRAGARSGGEIADELREDETLQATSTASVVVPRPETLATSDVAAGGSRRASASPCATSSPTSPPATTSRRCSIPRRRCTYPERFRGLHRLMLRDDGAVRCVACMCCPTVCPAHCITIVPEETGNGNEKRPAIFEIDELRCVVCGLCVEACPCDAIRMDTGEHAHPTEKRVERDPRQERPDEPRHRYRSPCKAARTTGATREKTLKLAPASASHPPRSYTSLQHRRFAATSALLATHVAFDVPLPGASESGYNESALSVRFDRRRLFFPYDHEPGIGR